MIALTRRPTSTLAAGERTFVDAAPVDHELAARQHADYCAALAALGVQIRLLPPLPKHPDAVFVEDTAVILDEVALLASMGAASRRAEVAHVRAVVADYRTTLSLTPPGTLEGGDVLRVDRELYVGSSPRTNGAGVEQCRQLLQPYGYHVRSVPVERCLHFKTACTALPDGRLLLNPDWVDAAALGRRWIAVPADEPWAANTLLVGDTVCASAQFPRTIALLEAEGYQVRPIDISELAKAEAGLTCLSLLIAG